MITWKENRFKSILISGNTENLLDNFQNQRF